MNETQRTLFKTIFGLYLLGLLYLLLLHQRRLDFSWWVLGGWPRLWQLMEPSVNWVPFRTLGGYLIRMNFAASIRSVLVNVGGHLALFAPLGFFLPRLRSWFQNIWIFIFSVLMLVLLIEVLQLLSMSGAFDVDDVLLNTLGACLGFIFLRNPEPSKELNHG
jgi:glycopeptide antibiotics resistance protein